MEWISVKDKLPEKGGYKLCVTGKNLPYIAMYHESHNIFTHNLENISPTHWMPLPDPPEDS